MVEENLSEAWIKKVKNNLLFFLRELADLCGEIGRSDKPRIIFASKYINSLQLILFIDLLIQLKIEEIMIGENRVQEAEAKFNLIQFKRADLFGKFSKIMIGNLQKNKINKALTLFDEIAAIDSLELAQAIDKRVSNKKLPIFLEVNLSGEETKHGISPDQLVNVIREVKLLKSLKLKGLMTIPPFTSKPQEIRLVFGQLKSLADKYGLLTSMGMSHDWKIAVEEGSDMLRIGGRIFG